MEESRNAANRRKKGFSWLGAGFLVLLLGGIGLCFTGFPGKVKRGLKEIFAPAPVVISPDEDDIRRQIESRLRAEMEQELEREIEAMKKAAAEKEAKEAAEAETAREPGAWQWVRSWMCGNCAPAFRSRPR